MSALNVPLSAARFIDNPARVRVFPHRLRADARSNDNQQRLASRTDARLPPDRDRLRMNALLRRYISALAPLDMSGCRAG